MHWEKWEKDNECSFQKLHLFHLKDYPCSEIVLLWTKKKSDNISFFQITWQNKLAALSQNFLEILLVCEIQKFGNHWLVLQIVNNC